MSTTTHDSMASDIFLVQQADGRKIQKPRQFAEEIRDVILKSNRAHRSNSTTPGTSRSSSKAPSRDPSAHGGSQFYSRDGGSNEGQARDLIKRATGSLVQHGDGKNIDGDGKLVEEAMNGEAMNVEAMNANGISEAEVTAIEVGGTGDGRGGVVAKHRSLQANTVVNVWTDRRSLRARSLRPSGV